MERGKTGLVVFIMVIAISASCGSWIPLYSSYTTYDDSYEAFGEFQRELGWKELAAILSEDSETESCLPVNVYSLFRHGTRYPGEDDIKTFQTFFTRLSGSSINPDYQYLKDEPEDRFTVDKAYKLLKVGFKEMSDIASRMKIRFPSLFMNTSSLLIDSSFQTTKSDRTQDSAKGLISGLVEDCTFGEANGDVIDVSCLNDDGVRFSTKVFWNKKENDLLLEPLENCQLYNELKDVLELDDEYLHFKDGAEMKQVQANVNKLLTGKDDFRVSLDELITLQQVCGIENALYGNSGWCDLFQTSDLRVMEYLRDLNEYWYSSYGYPINYEPSYVLLQNITSYLRLGVQQQSRTLKGIFKFAHSDTVQGLLTIMGLYRPSVPPRADNYPKDEEWDYSTAFIVPFASNVAFTLFRCGQGEAIDEDDFKVLVTHNEQPIKVGPCEKYFCMYKTLTSFLTSQIGICDFHAMCDNYLP